MSLACHEYAGFTLIEFTVVIVILGIISAVAIPRFINKSDDAKQTALTSIAAALTAASADNYARRGAGDTDNTSAINNCTGVTSLLHSDALKVGNMTASVIPQALYSVIYNPFATTVYIAANCTVSLAGGSSALFRGLGIQ